MRPKEVKLKTIVRKMAIGAAVMALSFVASAQARAQLYTQAYDNTGNLYASQNDPITYGNFATTYDNFTLGATSSINNVQWTGGYFSGSPSAISSFTLGLYADSGGTPGALVSSDLISGTANETFLTGQIYSYSANILPYTATAGTQYWLSIQATVGFPPQWGWATGTGGDGAAYQVFFGTGGSVPVDMAFTLNGSAVAVPEPSTLVLGALGALCMVGYCRFRRSAA